MTLYFQNDGELDLSTIRLMGVSVKEKDKPIGYFGTGLKYAIATLLRTGHSIDLIINKDVYSFRTHATSVRDKQFLQIYMNDEPLGFTTELGKNWQVWEAYRELVSNTKDEPNPVISNKMPSTFEGKTTFIVEGAQIELCFNKHNTIFLESEPLIVLDGLEIHHGSTNTMFYRGVKARQLQKLSLFTYNITAPLELTEDRTIKQPFWADYIIEQRLGSVENEQYLNAIIRSTTNFYEAGLSIRPPFSKEFLDAVFKERYKATISNETMKAVILHLGENMKLPEIEPSEEQKELIYEALNLAKKAGAHSCEFRHIKITDALGKGTFGLTVKGEDSFYISTTALDQGLVHLAGTIFEEWVHMVHGLDDESRGMQEFLLQRLMSFVART